MGIQGNQDYVAAHRAVFEQEKFFLNADDSGVTAVYYNPDSDAGGQLVYNRISKGLPAEAFNHGTGQEAWEHIDVCAKQYLLDIGSPDFMSAAIDFTENPGDFAGRSKETPDVLAERMGIAQEQSGPVMEMR
jgi:hypothetical protein